MKKLKLRRCNLKKFCKNCGMVKLEIDERGIGKCPTCQNKLYMINEMEKK